MIKYVALWELADRVTEDEFEAAYRRHIEAVMKRPAIPLGYRIGRILAEGGMDTSYYRMAELCFKDVPAFQEWMGTLTSLPEEDPANPTLCRKYMSSWLTFICEEEVLV